MDLHINLYEQHGRISPICEAKLNIAKISEKSVIAALSVSLCSVHSAWFTFALHGVLSLWFAFRFKAQIIVDGKYIEWCRFHITAGPVRSNKNKKGNCVLGRMSCCSSLFQFDCIPRRSFELTSQLAINMFNVSNTRTLASFWFFYC